VALASAVGGCPPFLHLRGGRAISRDQRVNQEIRAREVRLIGDEGQQLGVMTLRDALRIATEKGLDLVEVAPTAQPVVCRIMDYGRFKYEQAKRDRDTRRHQHVYTVKEVKLRPSIEDHDFDVKVRNAERFLREGDKVKVTVTFRGREIVHSNLGRDVLSRLVDRVRPVGQVEQDARVEGRNMSLLIAPRAEVQRQAEARAQEGRAGDGAPAAAPPAPAVAPAAAAVVAARADGPAADAAKPGTAATGTP
jgi:translation initiation factor IF-3